MDDAAMGTDLPQEEEYANANIIPDGYYNGWCFPCEIRALPLFHFILLSINSSILLNAFSNVSIGGKITALK